MKINAIRFKKKEIIPIGKEREVKGLIMTIALFACGMIIGSGLYNLDNITIEILNNIYSQYISNTNNAIQSVANEITMNCIMIAVIFLSGISCAGIPFVILSVFIKGLSNGLLAGFLFSAYSANGICYYLLTIFPAYISLNSAFLILGNNSFFMSGDLISIVTGRKQPDKMYFKEYLLKMCPIIMITVVASVFSVFLKKALGGLFGF